MNKNEGAGRFLRSVKQICSALFTYDFPGLIGPEIL